MVVPLTGVHSNRRLGGGGGGGNIGGEVRRRTAAAKQPRGVGSAENVSPRHDFWLSGSPLVASLHTLNDVASAGDIN